MENRYNRRLTKADIEEILSRRFANDIHTRLSKIPKPELLKDITRAAERIKEAITRKEKIAIVGDYDADGVVSSVIIGEFFEDIGVDIQLIIPNRFTDGYGINARIIDRLDADVIITVDNGISATEAAEICKARNIDLIITDHHTPPETLPDAYAIVNPKQNECTFPSSEICGAQVAWYLCAAIKNTLQINYDLSKFLDVLSIAIVADMMELRDINRTMVKSGLHYINHSKRPAFAVIRKFFNKNYFKSEDISYLLAPLINSAGRIEDATLSYDLLRAKDPYSAMEKLEYIVSLNNRRKEIEQELVTLARTKVDEQQNIVVVWGEEWHEGVIGIVASRLAKHYKKPAVVFSVNDEVAKGSARSVGSIDILHYIAEQKDLLLGYGGHIGAAGLSLSKAHLPEFKRRIEASIKDAKPEDFLQKSEILGELDPGAVDFELLELLERYEPYGQKNPMPLFIIKNAYVKYQKIIGKNNNHQKLILQSENATLESVQFNFDRQVKAGSRVDVICTISKNEFRGAITPQVMIRELLPKE